jgi:RNA polymerase II subunit A small phosphatase-like protein
MEKLLVILDLDETLIHAHPIPLENHKWDFEFETYKVYKRPFLEEFLEALPQYFRVAVWSSASDDYVQYIVDHIFPKNNPLEFVWGRSKCTWKADHNMISDMGYVDYQNHFNYAKLLRKVKKKGIASLERMVIVDDTPKKCLQNYGNAIYPDIFDGDKYDDELPDLLKYLITLKDVENVRTIEKRNYRVFL